ncbi:VWA domain-containing protein [bacterium]|nr:VWA domain-containing protein [bacterium]
MKTKVIISSIILSFCILLFSQNAKTEPNYSYKIYTPENFSQVSKNVEKSQKDSQILFIVDFSNSMNDSIMGVPKLDMARNTLAEILPKIPPNVKTGLRVYGHKAGFTYYQGCQASSLTVPLGYDNYQSILGSLYATRAVGWTPITYSLKQAINNDFAGVKGKKHIILLTDGGENCDESPCTYVINLMKTRDDVTIDVIAFDVHDIEANNQLKCTALMTSGKFLNANSQEDLANSLFETIGINKDVKGSIKIPSEY